jgi:hypothetical protein
MPYLRKRQNAMTATRQIISLTSGMVFFIAFLIPYNCFSQDSAKYEKILLVERTILKKGQTKPTQKLFHVGKKIVIKRYSNDIVLRGKIESISDTSIIMKRQAIPLTDIKTIYANRGIVTIKVGAVASTVTAWVTLAGLVIAETSINNVGYQNLLFFICGVAADIFTIPILIIGIIDHVTAKHYHLDRDFKIMVKTTNKKK